MIVVYVLLCQAHLSTSKYEVYEGRGKRLYGVLNGTR